jgi:hypothetical protein
VAQRKTNITNDKDKFSQEGILRYWDRRLSGHALVNQMYSDIVKKCRQFHIWRRDREYQIADLCVDKRVFTDVNETYREETRFVDEIII